MEHAGDLPTAPVAEATYPHPWRVESRHSSRNPERKVAAAARYAARRFEEAGADPPPVFAALIANGSLVPFACGIHKPLAEMVGEDTARKILSVVVKLVCYKQAVAAGGFRRDLDLRHAGEIAPCHRQHAEAIVAKRRARHWNRKMCGARNKITHTGDRSNARG